MTRATVSSALSADYCERISDNARELSQADQNAIETRAQELISARIEDGAHFSDLMAGIDAGSYEPYLHRALLHCENALAGVKPLEYWRRFERARFGIGGCLRSPLSLSARWRDIF